MDFNHPLAGKAVKYKLNIKRKVTDEKEKLDSLLSFYIREFKTEIKQDEAVISIKASIPKELQDIMKKQITALMPSIKKIAIKKE